MSKFALVGNPKVNRRDIYAKITGKRPYTSDIQPSNIGQSQMLYAGFVPAMYPNAIVKSIDTSEAEAAGYVTLVGSELPPYSLFAGGRDYTPIVSDKVIFAGQPVAAVAAPTANEVVDAIEKVKVEYQRMPYVFDQQEAMAPGAIQLWPGGNIPSGGIAENRVPIPAVTKISLGNVDAAFSAADVVVMNDVFETTAQQHFEIDPRGAVAYWKGGRLFVRASTQWAWLNQVNLASYFDLPLEDVEVSTSMGHYEDGGALGMGMGNKTNGEEYYVAAILAKKAGRAVKFIHTRFTHALSTTNRWPIRGYVKLGAKSDGTLTAMDVQLYINVGARGGAQGSDAASDFYNTYVCPNVNIVATPVNTDAFSLGAFMRSVGEEQGHFIMESAISELAQKLNMDPVKFRMKNMRTKADAVDPVSKKPYTTIAQPEALQQAMQAFDWTSAWKGWGVPSYVNGSIRRGVGVAIQNAEKGTPLPPSTSQVQVDPDGTVTVFIGLTDHGAGGNTTFPLIASEALGLTSMDNVRVIQSDTEYTTNASVTANSQSTHNSHSLLFAVQDLQTQWFPTIAKKLSTSSSTLAFANNTIYDTANPSNSISFKDAAALLTKSIKGYGTWNIPENVTYRVTGARMGEVEVDTDTGLVSVVRHVFTIGLGRTIFYKGAIHQMMGGTVQGISSAFYEEWINDPSKTLNFSGSYVNPNFHDYEVPTIYENPDNVTVIPVQNIDPTGPFGATGIGENCIIGGDVVFINALTNALGGYRFHGSPVRIEDIVYAIQEQKKLGKL